MDDLLAVPGQPEGVPWPTAKWPTGKPARGVNRGRLDGLLDRLFEDPAPADLGHTHGVAIVHRGVLVVERYGVWFVGDLEALAGKEPGPVGRHDPLLSWSMAKSVLHTAIGVTSGDQHVDITAPAPIAPTWDDPADPRHAITWDDLLTMRPGLAWTEEYYDFHADALPDVVTMLYGDGRHDIAGLTTDFPLLDRPGSPEAYRYSSGTTNILAGALQRTLGLAKPGLRAYLAERLFGPIGMGPARRRTSTTSAPGSPRRSSTPRCPTGRASVSSPSAAACGKAGRCCRPGGSTTGAGPGRPTTTPSMAPTGGVGGAGGSGPRRLRRSGLRGAADHLRTGARPRRRPPRSHEQ